MRQTTVLAVRRDGETVFAADGQITYGDTVLKGTAHKLRRLRQEPPIVAGFAGSTADGLALFSRLEDALSQANGDLLRASVNLAKEWRTDRAMRRLDALLLTGDQNRILMLTGNGDVIEPDEQVAAIGSGSTFALAASRALLDKTELSAKEIVETAMRIAADLCIYTNHEFTLEELSASST